MHSTSPGTITLSSGGVGRNIVEAAHRVLVSQGLPSAAVLLSAVGNDVFGNLLVEGMAELGMRTDGLEVIPQEDKRTAVCSMVFDGAGGLIGGVADMEIMNVVNENLVSFRHRLVLVIDTVAGSTKIAKPSSKHSGPRWKYKSRNSHIGRDIL